MSVVPADRPWLDPDLDVEVRVAVLLDAMTVAEKVGQLHMPANLDADVDHALIAGGGAGSSLYASGPTAGNVRDAGVMCADLVAAQRVAVEESRLGVPLLFGRDVVHGHRTVWPIPLGLAATFDDALARHCAELAAAEAAADGITWTFAPMVDLSADPRWGRVAESLGEQPVLAGRLGAALTEGFQTSISACAKHFVGYGLVAGGRDYNTVDVGENTLRNLHLRPFASAVAAGVASVMAAFTDVDGVPMHANRHLLRDVLEREWGFDGVVVSDWGGIAELVEHGVATDLRDAARLAMLAGVDVDMASDAYARHLPGLVRSGDVPPDVLDDAVRRVLRMKFRAGLFERPDRSAEGGDPETEAVSSESARALAREAAAASCVLVQNNGVLPLSPGERIHLTGPFVDNGDALLGTWVLDGRGTDVVTPLDAFSDAVPDLLVSDGRFSDVAVTLARRADVTVALVGEHPSSSGEDRSVSELGLPPGQLEFLRSMASVGTRLVVVVYTGRPLALQPVLELADAVLVAWHPGVEAGPALTDVILGRQAPSGRLPMTFPRGVGQVPTSSWARSTGRPIGPSEDRGRGRYLDALATPLFPFGFGLTYTSFGYGEIAVDTHTLPLDSSGLDLSIPLRNEGSRAGTEVVQLYVHDRVAEVTRPLVELADWQRVTLEAGQEVVVTFSVLPRMFGYHDREMRWRVDPGEVDVIVGPDAATGQRVSLRLVP